MTTNTSSAPWNIEDCEMNYFLECPICEASEKESYEFKHSTDGYFPSRCICLTCGHEGKYIEFEQEEIIE